jgi:hypothetical protein
MHALLLLTPVNHIYIYIYIFRINTGCNTVVKTFLYVFNFFIDVYFDFIDFIFDFV